MKPTKDHQERRDARTSLADYDEKTFIKKVLSRYASTATERAFDDCIIIDLADRLNLDKVPYLVYSMDHPSKIRRTLPEGLEWRFYGRWVAACTCGDVIAMGARPQGFSIDLGISLDTEVSTVEEFYQGVTDVLDHYGANLEGGNLDIGDRIETVGICWGIVERDKIVRRVGAQADDVVVVTTQPGIGWSSYLLSKYQLWDLLSPTSQERLANYNTMPVMPFQALQRVQHELPGAITSGMDLTDGLIEFLYTIAERNQVAVRLTYSDLPKSDELCAYARLLGIRPEALLFEPGYDTPRIHGYTLKRNQLKAAQQIFQDEGAELLVIGQVKQGSGVHLEFDGGLTSEIPWFCDDQFTRADVVERWTDLQKRLFIDI